MPTSQPVLMRALRWGLVMTAALMAIFAVIGWLVAQQPGLWGGLIGAGLGGVFLLMTVASIAFANRFVDRDAYIGVFFGIVLGTWVLKFILFIVLVVLLRGQDWADTQIMFFGVIAAVLGSLVLDGIIVSKARIPFLTNG